MQKKIASIIVIAGLLTPQYSISFSAQHLAPPSVQGLNRSPVKIQKKSWIEKNYPELAGKLLITLSMEGNIPEFDGMNAQVANSKGGLGVYFGDKLEGLADIGMNAIGCMPGYSKAIVDGKEVKIDYEKLADQGLVQRILTGEDAIFVNVWKDDPTARSSNEENPLIAVNVYCVNRGGTPLYLFVSPVHDFLYPDTKLHTYTQETVFGKAVKEFLKRQNLIPYIVHMNEAHTVDAAAQINASDYISSIIHKYGIYDGVADVYTVHTNVPEGLRIYHNGQVNGDIDRMMLEKGLPDEQSDAFRSRYLTPDGKVDSCKCAAEIATEINAVSLEQAPEVVKLFKKLYGKEYKVTGILNGSGRYWVHDEINKLTKARKTPSIEKLWEIHEDGKKQAFEEVKKRTGIELDMNKQTFWMVRRITEYKSQYPMLRYLVRVITADKSTYFTKDELKKSIIAMCSEFQDGKNQDELNAVLENIFNACGDNIGTGGKVVQGLGGQVVVGGPEYNKYWVDAFKRWADLPELKGRFVYVPDSNPKLLKMQAIGADVCINTPRPLDEACGTSDQRSGLNGGVNIAIFGAGPKEWITEYDEKNETGSGLFMGAYTKETPDGVDRDLQAFYQQGPADMLFKASKASRLFYDSSKKWKKLMLNSYLAAHSKVTAEHMEQRYAPLYLSAYKKNCNTRNICEMVIRDYYDPHNKTSGLVNARQELPVLAEAGVKYVVLVGLSKHNGKPYEIINPWENDKYAGTDEELEQFIKTAHELGLKVLFDIMGNQHLSKSSYILDEYPERYLYTNASDGNYFHEENPTFLVRGKDIDRNSLIRRIQLGKAILGYIKSYGLPKDYTFEIQGKKIKFIKADNTLRSKVSLSPTHEPVVFTGDEPPLFVVSATDLVSLQDGYPRVWDQLAQPDLGNEEVVKSMISLGKFRLSQGFDGFRYDAALSAQQDRVRENWGFKPDRDLTAYFVEQMRRSNPECFILFEGFERQHELLKIAGFEHVAAYQWEPSSYFTEAVQAPSHKFQNLLSYLRQLQKLSQKDISEKLLVSLGPEHDAHDLDSPSARLSYNDKFLMYFFYMLLPGYNLVFNGDIQGGVHHYKNSMEQSKPVPLIRNADGRLLDRGKKLFALRERFSLLNNGNFNVLDVRESGNTHIAISRNNHNEVVIGVFNLSNDDKWQTIDIGRVLMDLLPPKERMNSKVLKTNLKTDSNNIAWRSDEFREIPVRPLISRGLAVNVGPKGCEIIRLKLKRIKASPTPINEYKDKLSLLTRISQ